MPIRVAFQGALLGLWFCFFAASFCYSNGETIEVTGEQAAAKAFSELQRAEAAEVNEEEKFKLPPHKPFFKKPAPPHIFPPKPFFKPLPPPAPVYKIPPYKKGHPPVPVVEEKPFLKKPIFHPLPKFKKPLPPPIPFTRSHFLHQFQFTRSRFPIQYSRSRFPIQYSRSRFQNSRSHFLHIHSLGSRYLPLFPKLD
ncbi:unnamed protein product [Malus baccata var. baccata]